MGRLVCFTLALLLPSAALAAEPADCTPACRTGFFCHQGQCRSACNPPCGAGEQCLDTGQCSGSTATDGPLVAPHTENRPWWPTVSESGEKAPPGFHFETRRRKALIVSGSVLFGVGYLFSLFYGVLGYLAVETKNRDPMEFIIVNRTKFLFYTIPLAGPGLSQFLLATSPGYLPDRRAPELIFAGIVSGFQLIGLTLGILGFPSRQVLIEDPVLASRPPKLRWSIAPGAQSSLLGLTLLIEN
jgi:hypothetical protein